MVFSRQKLVNSQVFSLAPHYYLHIYIPVACSFLSLFIAIHCTTLHFNDYWKKNCYSLGVKNVY